MILIDSDVLMIEHRYQNDPRFAVNRQALQYLKTNAFSLGITTQVWLEVVSNLSFNVPASQVAQLPHYLLGLYKFMTYPDLQSHPEYAACTVQQLVVQINRRMALGDAIQAVQIALYAPSAECLLTWNIRHFQGKIVTPALTPQEWLNQQSASTP
jgi:hypothetical protein